MVTQQTITGEKTPAETSANGHAIVRAGLINPDLDFDALASAFAADRVVQIENALRPEAAGVLHHCLANEVRWSLAYRDRAGSRKLWAEELVAMSREELETLDRTIVDVARDGFQFRYDSFMMVTAYKEKRHPELVLHRAIEQLNSQSWLDAMRRITGFAQIRRADAQATRYVAGHFLRQHNDIDEDVDRLCAYVINLTREWHADWGGLLQILDEEGEVTRTLMPRYNSLSLLRVPTSHCVSPVAPFATGARYAITGWLMT